jgi:hypothetical protein
MRKDLVWSYSLDFGYHRRMIKDVSQKVLDPHIRVAVLDKLRGLCQSFFRSLNDDADGAYASAGIDMVRHA